MNWIPLALSAAALLASGISVYFAGLTRSRTKRVAALLAGSQTGYAPAPVCDAPRPTNELTPLPPAANCIKRSHPGDPWHQADDGSRWRPHNPPRGEK